MSRRGFGKIPKGEQWVVTLERRTRALALAQEYQQMEAVIREEAKRRGLTPWQVSRMVGRLVGRRTDASVAEN